MKKLTLSIEVIIDESLIDDDIRNAVKDFRTGLVAESLSDAEGVLWARSFVEEVDGESKIEKQ